MTEKDAKDKWCPLARAMEFDYVDDTYDVKGFAATNRGQALYDCQCLGSKCMAWVWIGSELDGDERHGICSALVKG